MIHLYGGSFSMLGAKRTNSNAVRIRDRRERPGILSLFLNKSEECRNVPGTQKTAARLYGGPLVLLLKMLARRKVPAERRAGVKEAYTALKYLTSTLPKETSDLTNTFTPAAGRSPCVETEPKDASRSTLTITSVGKMSVS